MVRIRTWIGTALFLVHGGLMAQPPVADRPIYPEKLHEDLEILRTTLHEAHPDPYRFVSAAGLDRAFAQVQEEVAVTLVPSAFREALTPVFQALGDPRCTATLPGQTTNGTPLIPLQVRIADGALYVDQELKGFRSLPPGAKITAINGHSASKILQLINAQVVAEGANTTLRHAIIGREFPQLFHRYVEQAAVFMVRYINAEGNEDEQRVAGLTQAEMNLSRQTARLPLWSHERVLNGRAMWFTARSLDRDSLAAAGLRPDRYLDALLKEMRAAGTEILVVDVRGAAGRDLAMAETVFAAFADMPFRAVKEVSTRLVRPLTHQAHTDPLTDHLAAVRSRFITDPNGVARMKDSEPPLQHTPPMRAPFAGKVYVVCDGMTRDAGAALVMMARRNGRARVIGEEVGTNAASFTGGRELRLTLPNSGVRVTIPLMRYVPEGMADDAEHGERPHHAVPARPGDGAQGRDTVRESLLWLLSEM